MTTKDPLSGPDAAARRAAVVQVIIALIFAAVIFAVTFALPGVQTPALRWALAAIPAAVLIVWAFHMFRAVRQADEMMQALFLRAYAIAGLIVLTAATAWGVVVEMLGAPDFPAFLLMPAFAIVQGAVMTAQRARG